MCKNDKNRVRYTTSNATTCSDKFGTEIQVPLKAAETKFKPGSKDICSDSASAITPTV